MYNPNNKPKNKKRQSPQHALNARVTAGTSNQTYLNTCNSVRQQQNIPTKLKFHLLEDFSKQDESHRSNFVKIDEEQIKSVFHLTQKQAAQHLGVSLSTLKRRFYEMRTSLNLDKWPTTNEESTSMHGEEQSNSSSSLGMVTPVLNTNFGHVSQVASNMPLSQNLTYTTPQTKNNMQQNEEQLDRDLQILTTYNFPNVQGEKRTLFNSNQQSYSKDKKLKLSFILNPENLSSCKELDQNEIKNIFK
ncbi:hypothetical protein ABK040_011160 [Willaertia magna]